MVRQSASGALLLSFPFMDLLLVNTGLCIGSDPMHYFLPRCRWFLCSFFLLFPSLVYPCYGGSNILKTSEYTRPVRFEVWRIRLRRQNIKNKVSDKSM